MKLPFGFLRGLYKSSNKVLSVGLEQQIESRVIVSANPKLGPCTTDVVTLCLYCFYSSHHVRRCKEPSLNYSSGGYHNLNYWERLIE